MKAELDFNCDLGEGCGDDAAIIPLISSASIACGGHAGDADTMRATVALCLQHGVAIGAHPSLPDREHFGRRDLPVTPTETRAFVSRQIEALATIASDQGTRLRHVKPHGALYNMSVRRDDIADAIAQATASFDTALVLVGLPGSALLSAGSRAGLRTAAEAFADRSYESDGSLTPRQVAGAVLSTPAQVAERVVRMVRDGEVAARDGSVLSLRADTICVHGDTPAAARLAAAVRTALEAAGIELKAL